VLGKLLAHLRVDLLLDLDQLDLALEQHEQAAQALGHVDLDQERRALFGGQIHGGRGDVTQARRILVLIENLRGLVGNVGRDGDELLGHVVDRHAQAVDLDGILADLDQRLVGRHQEGLFLHEAGHAPALDPAQHGGHAVLGGLDDANHLALDANAVKVAARGLFDVGVLLRADEQVHALAGQAFDQPQRRQAPDLDGHHRAGEQHQVSQRQQGQGFGCFRRGHASLPNLGGAALGRKPGGRKKGCLHWRWKLWLAAHQKLLGLPVLARRSSSSTSRRASLSSGSSLGTTTSMRQNWSPRVPSGPLTPLPRRRSLAPLEVPAEW
jgi:hypothetical protein